MIRVAVIGTGGISEAHLKAYTSLGDRCKVVALCDISPEKAEALKQKYNLDCEIFTNTEEVASHNEVDLVSVCTPPYMHAELAIACLNGGKHVLVEKPMASSLEECDRMLEAAERSQRILSVVSQNRFYNPIMKLKHVLDSGLLGKVVHAQADSFWWRGHVYYDLWWRGTWEKEGGGCTLNHAVHHIDMLQWLMGMPDRLQAVTSNTSHDNAEVEDLSIAVLSYGNGALAQITSSVVHHGEEQQLVFQTEKAKVSAPWDVYASVSRSNGFPERDPGMEQRIEEIYREYPEIPYTGHTGQIDDVLKAIENQSLTVLADGHEGRKTLELITAIYEAALTGRQIQLPLQPDSLFYTRASILANAPHFYEKTNSVAGFANNEITLGGNYQVQ